MRSAGHALILVENFRADKSFDSSSYLRRKSRAQSGRGCTALRTMHLHMAETRTGARWHAMPLPAVAAQKLTGLLA
jgi:hypothetical protein